MIIDITKCEYQHGYLARSESGLFHPFFPTANAAFRRSALDRIGGFDPRCATGEDVDLSVRVARAGFELWHQPDARVMHHDRHTLPGMWWQWFSYGFGHPYLYRKHLDRPRLQVYRYRPEQSGPDSITVRCVLDIPFPFYAMLFLGSFQVMHVGLLASILCFWMGWMNGAIASLALTGVSAVVYFSARFDLRKPLRSLGMSVLRYVAHAAYSLGGLLGGLRQGALFVEVTCWKPRRKPAGESEVR
jgi:cellulose synthase/poly-beta-1,6-N-acetylglucosamine synthase-like glycosyltransferase